MTTFHQRARLQVAALLGSADIGIGGNRPWDIHVHDDRFYAELMRKGSLGLGESYMAGWWDCEGIDQLTCRLLRHDLGQVARKSGRLLADLILGRIINFQNPSRAFEVAKTHYDLGNELYALMLDREMNYSCAYWRHEDASLAEAQEAKLQLCCEKLRLEPGMRVLDIGCGWGSFARYAAKNYGVEVVGVTISREQARFAEEQSGNLGVSIRLQDYREIDGKYDRVISLGMFEHVGDKNYRTFMEGVNKALTDGGLFLLQSIGVSGGRLGRDPWVKKYIFPHAILPTSEHIGRSSSGLLALEDWHDLGDNYVRTLDAWRQNFNTNWDILKTRYDQRFYRMWNYYLQIFSGGFSARHIRIWQVLFSKTNNNRFYPPVR